MRGSSECAATNRTANRAANNRSGPAAELIGK
jgi:hypothetical protein